MNQAARLISSSILDEDFITVILAGKPYTICPPTIKVLCRAIKSFSGVDAEDKETLLQSLSGAVENSGYIIDGLSKLIAGNVKNWEPKSRSIAKKISNCNVLELKVAMVSVTDFIKGGDFFDCAILAKDLAEMAAKQK